MDNDQIEMIIRAILSRPEFIRAVAAELNKFKSIGKPDKIDIYQAQRILKCSNRTVHTLRKLYPEIVEMFKSHGSHIAQALPRNCLGRRTLAQIRPLGSGTRRPNPLRTVFEIAVCFIMLDKTYNMATICIVYKAL